MKHKLSLLLIASLLIVGCTRKNQNSSFDSGDFSSSDTSSSEEPPKPVYYDDYYGDLEWTDGEDLKSKLHDIISTDINKLSYDDPNWETNIFADHTMYDYEYVDVIYNAKDIPARLTNKSWQREHAFCASLMTGSTTSNAVKCLGRATDFHNLFAGDTSGNTSRGNKNYGFADKTAESYQDRTVNNGYDGYSFDSMTFEPGNKDKGRVARAIFYMALMYNEAVRDDRNDVNMQPLSIVEENVNYVAGNNCHFAIGHFSDLLNWATTYDVDYLEMQHNESVYSHVYSGMNKAQNNRNPFVDYPELIEYTYGDKQNIAGKLSDLTPACVTLDTMSDDFSHYAIGEARREYAYGETCSNNDIIIYSVNKDFSYYVYEGVFQNSLEGHTFTEDDGDSIDATITIGPYNLNYTIILDPVNACSTPVHLTKAGISNTKANVGVDQSVTYDDINFIVNANLNYSSNNNWTIQNLKEGVEGFKMGSGTYPLTGFTIKTVDEYTVDAAFIKAYAANTSSSYSIVIKVGTKTIYSGTVAYGKEYSAYGVRIDEPYTGQVSFTFTGTNSLALRDLAFNETY